MERYHNIGGHLRLDPNGTLTSYEQAQREIEALTDELGRWRRGLLTVEGTVLATQAAEIEALQQEVSALRTWRIDVTAALLRPGGAFYDDVPKHVKEMAEQNADLHAQLTQRTQLIETLIHAIEETSLDQIPAEVWKAAYQVKNTLDTPQGGA